MTCRPAPGPQPAARLGAVLLATVTLAGCPAGGDREGHRPGAAHFFGRLPAETVELGTGAPPRLFVPALRFDGEHTTAAEVDVESGLLLEFLPLAAAAGSELRTFVVADGEESLIDRASAAGLSGRAGAAAGAFAALRSVRRIDLSAWAGRRVAFRWELGDPSEALAGAVGRPSLRRRETDRRRPDILLICSDTHRYDFALGERGAELMPTLRTLADGARVFRRASSTASWTLPAIASTLTGLFPRFHLSGQRRGEVAEEEFDGADLPAGRFGFPAGSRYRLLTAFPSALTTLPELLRTAGYTTAIVASNPLYGLSGLLVDGFDLAVDAGVVRGERVNRSVEELLDFIPRRTPLFLMVHFMEAHQWDPWYFRQRYPELDRRRSPLESRASYAAAVRDTDRALDRLLTAWRARRRAGQSVVVFFSDHGEHLLDDPAAPRLGHGNSMEETLLHVPLVLRAPGLPAGTVDAEVSLVDLLPTLLELAGAALPDTGGPDYSGRSLLTAEPETPPRELFADFQLYRQELSSVRRGPFKLIFDFDRETVVLEALPGAGAIDESRRERLRRSLRQAFVAYERAAREATAELEFDAAVDQQQASRALEALGYVR